MTSLTKAHQELLLAAAIDLDVADEAGVRSEPGRLVFPWTDLDGNVVDQLRPDNPGDGPKYLFPKDTSVPLWVHRRMVDRVGKAKIVVFAEGTKQYLAAVSAAAGDVLVVGMGGCWGWSSNGLPVSDVEKLLTGAAEVYAALDADVATNPTVWQAADRLSRVVKVMCGADIKFVKIPAPGKIGLDDWLANVADKPTVFANLLGAAGKLPRAPRTAPPGLDVFSRPAISLAPPTDPYKDIPHEPGAQVLDAVVDILTTYVIFPSDEAARAAALFVAATHAQPCWEHATRLVIKSPIKRCGKSRLEETSAELVHAPLRTSNVSVAALVRSISDDDPPTLMLDEADAVFSKRRGERSEGAEDLRGILNAGHSRGAPYLRWNMNANAVDVCPTFAMAIIAGIGDLPDTIEDRAVIISMRRRLPDERVTPYRQRHRPQLHAIRTRVAAWIHRHLPELSKAEPDLPVEDRAADVWEPLVAIADAAGGDWPRWAREACVALTSDTTTDTTSGEELLRDLRTVFGDDERLSTTTVLERLAAIDESPWSDWNQGRGLNSRALAQLLRPYGVRSKNVRTAGGQTKGYERADLTEPWRRYLPGEASQASQASQGNETPASAWDGSGTESASDIRPSPEQDKDGGWDAGTDGTPDGRDPRPYDNEDPFDFGRFLPEQEAS